MAKEFIAGGSGRTVWRAFKQALFDSPLAAAGRQRGGGNAHQQQKMFSSGGYFSSLSSPAKGEMEMARDLSTAVSGWRDFVARRLNSRRIPGERRSNYCTEGLSTLISCHRRPDATIVQRSATGMRTKCTQLLNDSRALDYWRSTALVSVRKVHSSVIGSSSTSLANRQMQQGRLVFGTTSAREGARRNLSSGTTWTERWDCLKRLVGSKQTKANNTGAGGAASVGLKSSGDILSEVASPLRKTLSRYREAIVLQIEAFWKRNYLIVVGLVGLGICLLLWRLMFGIASTFISMSEGLAKFGFLALAASMVIVGGVIWRARYTINPDAVHRIAMRRLNASAAVLEVMGAPLSGSELRAYIVSGGGLRLKGFRPRLAAKRCFIIFPIQGHDRKGLVSIEVKKKKGQYNFKLLAVDVPTAGADQRLFLIGDEQEYKIGGGLMNKLRDPIVKAMAAQKEFEDLDLKEEEEDERKAMEAEQRRAAEEQRRAEEELDRLAKEKEARDQDEFEKSVERPVATDDVEKPAEHSGKEPKPLAAEAA